MTAQNQPSMRPDREENLAGEPDYLTVTGDETLADSRLEIDGDDEPADAWHGNDYSADPDSGFFGAGSNDGEGNDNLERETTPGFQRDKTERGTIMPH